jgi:hypothetical protein
LFNGTSPTGNGNNLAQVSVKATNADAGDAAIAQLFNYLRPISEIYNAAVTTYAPGIFPNITLAEAAPNTIVTDSRTYFDQTGSLFIKKDADEYVKIEGLTVPYSTLVKGAAIMPFQVKRLRYSYTSESQLDQEIVIFKRTIFGKYTENRISPRSYFDPNQQQSKVVDIPIEFGIDAETGIEVNLLASEVVTFNFFCDVISRPAI